MCADWLKGGYQSSDVSSPPQSLQQASQSRRKLQDQRQGGSRFARKRGNKLTEEHWGGAPTYFNITASCFLCIIEMSGVRRERYVKWNTNVFTKYFPTSLIRSHRHIFTRNWKPLLSNKWIPGAAWLKFFFTEIACLFSRLLWIELLWLFNSEFLPLCAAVNQGLTVWVLLNEGPALCV